MAYEQQQFDTGCRQGVGLRKFSVQIPRVTIHQEVPKLLYQQELHGLVAKALDC
jgi:hypothetical protein